MLGLCLYGTIFVLPVYLQQLQGFTANQTGLVILPGALASAVTMGVMARQAGKFDARISVVVGVAIFLTAMWQMSQFTTLSGKPDLRVSTSDANIRVDTWDQNTIEARVTADGWKIKRLVGGQSVSAVEQFIGKPQVLVAKPEAKPELQASSSVGAIEAAAKHN